MEEIACSACPPALAYSYFYFFARPCILVINKNALIDKRGIKANKDRANSHPLTKAIIIPDMQTETVYRKTDIFSPMAPWNASVSKANFDDNSDWFSKSNHDIYCFSKLFKYVFRHLIACLSPVNIQHPNIIPDAKNCPIPKYTNKRRVYLDKSTNASAVIPEKLFIMSPQSNPIKGKIAPLAIEAIVPMIIKA